MKKLAVLFMCAAMLASCDFKGGSKDLKAEWLSFNGIDTA